MSNATLIRTDDGVFVLGTIMNCHSQVMNYRIIGVMEGPNPLEPFIPIFFIQLIISIIATNLLTLAMKPLNQPPFVGKLLAGILLGPSGFGRIKRFRQLLFPNNSLVHLEPISHVFICYYAFLMGVKMDKRACWEAERKAKEFAITGIIIPLIIGLFLPIFMGDINSHGSGLFCGAALSVTGFHGSSNIFENQKIFRSDMGKIMTSAFQINEIISWILLGIAFLSVHNYLLVMIPAYLISIVLLFKFIKPGVKKIVWKTLKMQNDIGDKYLCWIIVVASLCGVVTDYLGTHAMVGCFMVGLVLPNSMLRWTMVKRMEDLVVEVFMPMFVVLCGLRTNIDHIVGDSTWPWVAMYMAIACLVKPLSAFICHFGQGIPLREAMVAGMLGNNKNVLALIFLEASRVDRILAEPMYSMLVAVILLMTMCTTVNKAWYQHIAKKIHVPKTIEDVLHSNEKLQILACIYENYDISSMIDLFHASNPTRTSPISIFAVQLFELKDRAKPIIEPVPRPRHLNENWGAPPQKPNPLEKVFEVIFKYLPQNPNSGPRPIEGVIDAFYDYEKRYWDQEKAIKVENIMARSRVSNMAEDICSIAIDHRVTFIIVPFHKLPSPQGNVEEINPFIRSVNESLLANAPCSIGILFDRRGFRDAHGEITNAHKIVVLYFGGPDDREALTYAQRMVARDGCTLTVVRFVPSSKALLRSNTNTTSLDNSSSIGSNHHVSLDIGMERENMMDDIFLGEFNKVIAGNPSIDYNELVLDDEEEMINALKSIDEHKFDLYLVGRGRGMFSPLTKRMAHLCDYPELGPIGEILVTSELESLYSVLVVQQFVK